MSDASELFRLATQDGPADGDEVREAIERFAHAYAHELAERIRARTYDMESRWLEHHGSLDRETELAIEAMREAADLIDSEVP